MIYPVDAMYIYVWRVDLACRAARGTPAGAQLFYGNAAETNQLGHKVWSEECYRSHGLGMLRSDLTGIR